MERVMINTNKFVVSDTSFDPETLNLLSDAFEDAWLKIQRSDKSVPVALHAATSGPASRLQRSI
jgi:hypothetical protein